MVVNEYNPLDYDNLTKSVVQELMGQGPFILPLEGACEGAGVYALFYCGSLPIYKPVVSPKAEVPIYVGKAVPPGARKGSRNSGSGRVLFQRVGEHVRSIEQVPNLQIEDFLCRYLIVTPLWITMAERFLIENFSPVWNVCLEGFGLHDPGSGRYEGELSWWDTLHTGRSWAGKLKSTRTEAQAKARLVEFFES